MLLHVVTSRSFDNNASAWRVFERFLATEALLLLTLLSLLPWTMFFSLLTRKRDDCE